jgi:hypothetical protein
MFFWNRNKKQFTDHPAPRVSPRPSSSGRRFSVEIKLLAAKAKDAGLGPKEVADLVGASPYTVTSSLCILRGHDILRPDICCYLSYYSFILNLFL